jgi:hypothetical protein
MSVRPTLLRDIKLSAAQQHQAKVGIGTYNRYSPLTPRGRILSSGKRQLEIQGEDDGNANKAPKLDSNLVFDQLKEQDSIIAEVESTIAEIEKSNIENPDSRLNAVIKVLKLLGKSQKNLTSAVTDNCKLAATKTPVTYAAHSLPGQKKANSPPPPVRRR